MASLPPSLSSILFLTLALILMSASPAFSSSRKSLDDHHDLPIKTGFKLTLTSVDSGENFTTIERLHRQMKRGRHRLEKLSERILTSEHPIRSMVYPGQGEFLMNLSIGTPPQPYYAIMDTGSDLVWTQCQPCIQCFPQPTPLYDPMKSSSFSEVPCSSNLCKALPISNCSNANGCEYLYIYGDGDSTSGVLGTETFTFEEVSVPNIGFGCGEINTGDKGNGAGLVGLGRGALSLVSQLDEPKFSYCLTYFNGTKPSTLLMGSQASSVNCPSSSREMKNTPLIKNPVIPTFYYLSLKGITVGSTRLPINETTFALHENGTGGVFIDSGTSITHLVESAFSLVKEEFISQVNLPTVNATDSPWLDGLDLCFQLPSGSVSVDIPSLVFHFQDADLDLPKENYMITDSSVGVMCLAMGKSSDGSSVFGNIQQQNILVVYDLSKETVSFMPTECDQC
ncbi:hypothetical protein Vadar_015163 [Vaccinium darrowii]|uniref:Uncharacterized protein n=1 Tax=Vaccinium darrowii TaxID=229202 RepID=A0ACB7Z5I3_9ERIC|nr:hypothetical protein Vadar_015163 [Vaccinium darrowii]